MPFCTACGHQNVDNARFCNACGQPIAAATPPPPDPEPPPETDSTPPAKPPPSWGREQTKGCIFAVIVVGVVLFIVLVLVGTLCGEDIPDDPEARRQWEADKQTKEAAEVFEEQTKEAVKAAENAIEQQTKEAEDLTKEQTKTAENATKEAAKASEEATKEAGRSLDQKRKDAGLPSCTDNEDEVIRRANFFVDTFGDIKKLEGQRLEEVVVDGDDSGSVTCTAVGRLDNIFDGTTEIRYQWNRNGDNLWVDVSHDVRRMREEATKAARDD